VSANDVVSNQRNRAGICGAFETLVRAIREESPDYRHGVLYRDASRKLFALVKPVVGEFISAGEMDALVEFHFKSCARRLGMPSLEAVSLERGASSQLAQAAESFADMVAELPVRIIFRLPLFGAVLPEPQALDVEMTGDSVRLSARKIESGQPRKVTHSLTAEVALRGIPLGGLHNEVQSRALDQLKVCLAVGFLTGEIKQAPHWLSPPARLESPSVRIESPAGYDFAGSGVPSSHPTVLTYLCNLFLTKKRVGLSAAFRDFEFPIFIQCLAGTDSVEEGRISASLQWLFDSYAANDTTSRFLSIVFCIEALLSDEIGSPSRSVTDVVSDRLAVLTGSDQADRKKIRDGMRKAYSVRSKLVHGEKRRISPTDFDEYYSAVDIQARRALAETFRRLGEGSRERFSAGLDLPAMKR
jgi:hypothetical protein